MSKTKEERITNVSQWMKLFNSSALYKHEPSRLFEDYLDLVLCCMANQRQEERYLKVAARYTRDELNTVSQLMAYHILIHEHQVNEYGWYDMLGDIYMELASRSKASRMGQFFTPAPVCDMMAKMTIGDPAQAEGKTCMDPAAGSGRTLLAIHALQPKIGLVAAADLDPICAKMCALNFWMHGIRGEVAQMNSLSLEWFFAWQTHPRATWPFVTFLDDTRKEESIHYRQREKLLTPVPKASAELDLFSQVEEPAAEYGEPFRPCDLCGCVKSITCRVVDGRVVEPWEFHGPEHDLLTCPECGAILSNLTTVAR